MGHKKIKRVLWTQQKVTTSEGQGRCEHAVEVHVAHRRVRVALHDVLLVHAVGALIDKLLRLVLAVGVLDAVVVAPARVVVLHHGRKRQRRARRAAAQSLAK